MTAWEPYLLALGAVLGALIRAYWTSGQPSWTWSNLLNPPRETVQDVFFAAILGMLWPYQLTIPDAVPMIGGIGWPPLHFPPGMPLPARAALMALLAALFIGTIKKVLLQFPAAFEKITGTAIPAKNGVPPTTGVKMP